MHAVIHDVLRYAPPAFTALLLRGSEFSGATWYNRFFVMHPHL